MHKGGAYVSAFCFIVAGKEGRLGYNRRATTKGESVNTMSGGITPKHIAATKPDCLAGAAIEEKGEGVGVTKATMSLQSLIPLSMLAGLFIGMGALFMTYIKADQTLSFAASSVLGGLVFSLGLICVVVAGAELFTGNSLMVMAALSKKITWGSLAKNWVLVWVFNLVGSLVLVGLIYGCGLMGTAAGDNSIGNQMVAIAAAKINLSPVQILFRGIMCNLLVCLAVYMGFAGRTVIDKIFTCIFPVMAFVAMGFEHCVANMFFLPMGVLAVGAGFGGQLDASLLASVTAGGACYNICLATVGNIIGGAVFVGVLYWWAYHKRA